MGEWINGKSPSHREMEKTLPNHMMNKSQVSDFLLFYQKMCMLLYINNRSNNVTKSSGKMQPGGLGGEITTLGLYLLHYLVHTIHLLVHTINWIQY